MSGGRLVSMSREQRDWLAEAYASGVDDSWNVPVELVAAFDAASPAAADAPASLRSMIEPALRERGWRCDHIGWRRSAEGAHYSTWAAVESELRREIESGLGRVAAERGEPMGEREDILRRALEGIAAVTLDGLPLNTSVRLNALKQVAEEALAEADRLPPDDAQQRLAQIAESVETHLRSIDVDSETMVVSTYALRRWFLWARGEDPDG